MGTTLGPNEEWIELYNDGASGVVLDGWTLSDNVSLTIPLVGTIEAGAYALLERTDDETVPGIPAFQIYTGALANGGQTLTLYRTDASIEDQVAGGANWENIGGDNTTKNTAQRTSGGWVTATPTPGSANEIIATPSDSESETNQTSVPATQTGSGGGGTSARRATIKSAVAQPAVDPVLTLSVGAPRIVYVHENVPFEVTPTGIGKTLINSLRYTWNFGDTYTTTSKDTAHTFEYPGEYIVVVGAEYAKQKAVARHEITVLPVSFSLARSSTGDILLHNNAKYEVDIGGYSLTGDTSLIFPKFTILKPNATLTIGGERISTEKGKSVSLYDIQKTFVTSDSIENSVEVPRQPNVTTQSVLKNTVTERSPEPIRAIPNETKVQEEVSASTSTESASNELIPIGKNVASISDASTGFFTKENLPFVGFLGIMSLGILALYTKRIF
jgi:hypothetical protein